MVISRTRRRTRPERTSPSVASKSPAKAARTATGRIKIGAAAATLHTTTRTLTFYEDEGLIRPKRTPRGTRLYSQDDIKRASIVQALSGIGVGMQRIKQIALARQACNSGKESSHKIVPMLETLEHDLVDRIAKLTVLREDVRRGAELIRACWYCTRKPSRTTCKVCPVEARLDDSLTARLVWDPDRGD